MKILSQTLLSGLLLASAFSFISTSAVAEDDNSIPADVVKLYQQSYSDSVFGKYDDTYGLTLDKIDFNSNTYYYPLITLNPDQSTDIQLSCYNEKSINTFFQEVSLPGVSAYLPLQCVKNSYHFYTTKITQARYPKYYNDLLSLYTQVTNKYPNGFSNFNLTNPNTIKITKDNEYSYNYTFSTVNSNQLDQSTVYLNFKPSSFNSNGDVYIEEGSYAQQNISQDESKIHDLIVIPAQFNLDSAVYNLNDYDIVSNYGGLKHLDLLIAPQADYDFLTNNNKTNLNSLVIHENLLLQLNDRTYIVKLITSQNQQLNIISVYSYNIVNNKIYIARVSCKFKLSKALIDQYKAEKLEMLVKYYVFNKILPTIAFK